MGEEEKKYYCEECGNELNSSIVGAENFPAFVGSSINGDKYDHKTGKRRYFRKYLCPKYRKNFFGIANGHSSFRKTDEEVILKEEEDNDFEEITKG